MKWSSSFLLVAIALLRRCVTDPVPSKISGQAQEIIVPCFNVIHHPRAASQYGGILGNRSSTLIDDIVGISRHDQGEFGD